MQPLKLYIGPTLADVPPFDTYRHKLNDDIACYKTDRGKVVFIENGGSPIPTDLNAEDVPVGDRICGSITLVW